MTLIVDEQREELRQTHVGEQQVVDAITEFECFVDLLEYRDDLARIAHQLRFEILLYFLHVVEGGECLSAEMHPVDAR